MLFSNIDIIDESFQIQKAMYLGVTGKEISYLSDIGPENPSIYGEEFNGQGMLIMPGFVNNHAHSPMTLMRGYGENMALSDWLNKRIFPFEAKLEAKDVYYGTLLAIAESLKFGITSTTDMYYFSEAMAKAVLESGVKNNLSRSLVNFSGEPMWNLSGAIEMKEIFEEYHMAGEGRLRIDMSLHGEYTSDAQTVEALAYYTKSIGANMHVHLSETQEEHESCKKRHGKTPTKYLEDLGLFDSKTTAAHCVWLEDEDMEILKEKKVTVASCPISNLKLASGIANIPKMMAIGIPVSIGTDSVASNNNLNFLEDMKVFAMVSKMAFKDPRVLTPKETIYAATRQGALAQGREDTGVIRKGKKADLTVLDMTGPHVNPVHDLLNSILYSSLGSDIRLTMVEGEVLYRDGEFTTIDLEKVLVEVNKSVARILGNL